MQLTIAIITKSRPIQLEKCIKSIINQSLKNFTLLIIDNDSEKTAFPVFEKYKKEEQISFEYISEDKPGYSNARNCALQNCHTKYIGFIDDDCILDKNWVSNGLQSIEEYSSAYVVGNSTDIFTENAFSFFDSFIRNIWKGKYYSNEEKQEILPFHLDTKNVIINTQILEKHGISFDNRFNSFGGEDADLGFQLKNKNQVGIYNNEMTLKHYHDFNKQKFKRKAFAYGYNCFNLSRKWNSHPDCIDWDIVDEYSFFNKFQSFKMAFFQIRNVNVFRRIQLYFLIKVFNYKYLKGFHNCRLEIG